MRLTEVLRAYRDAGVFPENRERMHRQPVFVDGRGTRCAMAHLIESTGQPEDLALVRWVAQERNLAYIAELADLDGLQRWLEVHGLSVDEAAAIQPAYGYCVSRSELICGSDFDTAQPGRTVARALLVEPSTERLEPVYEIVEIIRAGDRPAYTVGESIRVHAGDARFGDAEQILLVKGRWSGRAVGLNAMGRVVPVVDPCDSDLSLTVPDFLELIDNPSCLDVLDERDGNWASGYCVQGLGQAPDVQCSEVSSEPPSLGAPPAPPVEPEQPTSPAPSTDGPESCRNSGEADLWPALALAGLFAVRRRRREYGGQPRAT